VCDHCGCRNFAPIAELTAEHVEILALAWQLTEAHQEGRSAPEGVAKELYALLEVHDAKEEVGLYPILSALGGLDDDVRAQLEAEHAELFEVLDHGVFDRKVYYSLESHIELEEHELFSGAMLRYDEAEWEEMSLAHHAVEHAFGRPHSHGEDDHHHAHGAGAHEHSHEHEHVHGHAHPGQPAAVAPVTATEPVH